MTLALTCALCAAAPALGAGASLDSGRVPMAEVRLTLREFDAAPRSLSPRPPAAALPLVPSRLPDQGSGDGEGHSDHMGTMWIVMGAMMAVMMVGVGVYAMRHNSTFMERPPAAVASPAQLAVPVTVVRGGGG